VGVTAVLVLAFNRPDCAEVLAHRLRKLGGLRIYVSIDGARPDRPDELRRVHEVREVLRDVLADSVVAERAMHQNLGCADAVASALHWFFDTEPEGVILEDDCIPTPEFFEFADMGLSALRYDDSVGAICGVNYAPSSVLNGEPAARTRFFPLWGWAAWRRSVQGFAVRRPDWNTLVRRSPEWNSLNPIERRDWKRMFSVAGQTQPHTWDYQFVMHQWLAGRDSVVPAVPLVENVGFESGSHYSAGPPGHYYMSTDAQRMHMMSVLKSRRSFAPARSRSLDRWTSKTVFSPSVGYRVRRRVQRFANG
jgi:hypothetical protein